jgi:hypothetical protein
MGVELDRPDLSLATLLPIMVSLKTLDPTCSGPIISTLMHVIFECDKEWLLLIELLMNSHFLSHLWISCMQRVEAS